MPSSFGQLSACLVLILSATEISGVSLTSKRLLTRDYPSVTLPIESNLIKEEAAQVLLSSLLLGSVSVPSFVSDKDVPTSFARFRASSGSSTEESEEISTSAPSLIDSFNSMFAPKKKTLLKKKLAPIVLLHGFDSSAIEYRRLAPLIAQERDVYIPDILGWGFSDHSDVLSFTPAAKMAHLKCFVNDIVGEPCVVVGASLGGAIAILLATESPELVEKVVLIDAQGFIDGKGPSNTPDFVARFGVNVLKSTPLRMFANYIAYKDKTFATWDAMLIGRLHCLIDTWQDTSVAFLLSGGFVMSPSVPLVAQETLVIWGRNDEILEPSTAFKFVEQLPQCKELKWIENCGHVPHLEKPVETAKAILTFLGDIEIDDADGDV